MKGITVKTRPPVPVKTMRAAAAALRRTACAVPPPFMARRLPAARGRPDAQDGNGLAYQFWLFPGHDGVAAGVAGHSRVHIFV